MRRAVIIAVVVAVALGAWAVIGRPRWARRLLPPKAPRNLLLVSLDTTRADHLGCYGYAAAQTPRLDALAGSGLRFEKATTVVPLTLPAHSSLLTGTFPAWHGVRDNGGFYLGDEQVTLAEVLRDKGYRTGGFIGALVLDRPWGISQGFERYFDEFDLARLRLARQVRGFRADPQLGAHHRRAVQGGRRLGGRRDQGQEGRPQGVVGGSERGRAPARPPPSFFRSGRCARSWSWSAPNSPMKVWADRHAYLRIGDALGAIYVGRLRPRCQ